jgi:hypothetical protein
MTASQCSPRCGLPDCQTPGTISPAGQAGARSASDAESAIFGEGLSTRHPYHCDSAWGRRLDMPRAREPGI